MATLTLDTYQFIQALTKTGMPESQAKALAEQLKNASLHNMSTKEDITRLEIKIEQAEKNLLKWIVPLLLGQAALIVALQKLL